jgi:hypothetical protein
MEKKIEKRNTMDLYVLYSFWTMIVLFVAMMALSYAKLQVPSLVAGILFILSIFFVFICSIKALVPKDKSTAYIALSIAIIFILYILFSATFSVSSSVLG